ncbi:DddA-like double-stranded DNA deaminase toxin [Actinopolyspora mortivallis]|uniref:DddA-like double-stranded DNA deaminase toxin n=1 Tax=Actinopolyspora mortivallis TaxID=33906 RepID=UPI0003AA0BEF|nr:DddA-like double-stranded DNA deaminase toxin [Actinopolyspora mortivallis]
MSEVEELANTLAGMFGRLPPEHLHRVRAWIEEYALPTLAEIGPGSSSPELAQAVALLERARERVDEVLGLSESTRGHLVGYLATLGISGEQPPPSLPHPSTYRPPVSDDPDAVDEWVRHAREKLPERPGGRGKTVGILRGIPGSGDVKVQSGGSGRRVWKPGTERWEREPEDEHNETPQTRQERQLIDRIDTMLVTVGERFPIPRPDLAMPETSTHVETKVAMRMREAGITHAAVAINNEMCDGPLGCRAAVAAILPKGYVLDVYEPGATRPVRIEGQA